MGLRLRIGLLLVLCAAAALTGAEAIRSMEKRVSTDIPEEVYAHFSSRADSAEFYLKNQDGFVAVFSGGKSVSPITVTDIEVSGLRDADKAMLKKGIPVINKDQLLELLEDLGS